MNIKRLLADCAIGLICEKIDEGTTGLSPLVREVSGYILDRVDGFEYPVEECCGVDDSEERGDCSEVTVSPSFDINEYYNASHNNIEEEYIEFSYRRVTAKKAKVKKHKKRKNRCSELEAVFLEGPKVRKLFR